MLLVGTEEKMSEVLLASAAKFPRTVTPRFMSLMYLLGYYNVPLDSVSMLFQSARCIFLRLNGIHLP